LKDTRLARVNLTNATYTPASPPPDAYVAGIQGLATIFFPQGEETGLVQLRELLQKAGLRDLEREATFTLERGKTWHLLNYMNYWVSDHPDIFYRLGLKENFDKFHEAQKPLSGVLGFDLVGLGQAVLDHPQVVKSLLHHPGAVGEGMFRLVAFDLTTAYGFHPARALLIMIGLGALLILVYVWPIRFATRPPDPAEIPCGSRLIDWVRRIGLGLRGKWTNGGIYRIWPTDRIEVGKGEPELINEAKIERLRARTLDALGYAAYFSLLSAFHIGWRDFNVGSWIARIQSREYTLRATGWVRVIAGLQSLLSVYLLAIWALTYFGRPFQ
jgi:hypothetical protein